MVHKLKTDNNAVSVECNHPTQLTSTLISKEFSKVRDKLGLYSQLTKNARPTFHEIRALAAHEFEKQGYNPQARMAHTDEKSTKVYTRNHLEWVRVPAGEIVV